MDGWMYCGGSYVKMSAVVPDAVGFLFVCIDNLVGTKTGNNVLKKTFNIKKTFSY